MRDSETETSQYGQIVYDSVFCGAQNSLNYIRLSYVLRFNNLHIKFEKYLFLKKNLIKYAIIY